jgi:hypothetical protein
MINLYIAVDKSCDQHGNIGPWKVMEGLPTLEDHRDLPIEVQAKHLLMTGLIDDIIISNAYAYGLLM